jgi:hypothetical protein
MIPKTEMFGNGCIQKINDDEYLCCMSEDLNIIAGTKAEQYESLIPQKDSWKVNLISLLISPMLSLH